LLRDDALLAWLSLPGRNGGVRDDAIVERDGSSSENSIDEAIGSLEIALAGCCEPITG
jgi:hypothetical protein